MRYAKILLVVLVMSVLAGCGAQTKKVETHKTDITNFGKGHDFVRVLDNESKLENKQTTKQYIIRNQGLGDWWNKHPKAQIRNLVPEYHVYRKTRGAYLEGYHILYEE